MVLQINNLQALERLIGGDTEIEFEIRQNIVDAFVKKHLKQVATEEIVKNAISIAKEELNSLYFIKSGYWHLEMSNQGKTAFNVQIKALIDQAVFKAFNESEPVIKINEVIESVANRLANDLSDQMLEPRVNFLVDQKIKERLGL